LLCYADFFEDNFTVVKLDILIYGGVLKPHKHKKSTNNNSSFSIVTKAIGWTTRVQYLARQGRDFFLFATVSIPAPSGLLGLFP
jgi:hypothetical protein